MTVGGGNSVEAWTEDEKLVVSMIGDEKNIWIKWWHRQLSAIDRGNQIETSK